MVLRGRGRCRLSGLESRLLAIEAHVLFLDGIGHLGSLPKEVEVLAHSTGAWCATSSAECFIVEGIVGFVQLVAQTIVGVLKLKLFTRIVTAKGKGIVRMGEARRTLVVAGRVKAEERHCR